MKNDFIVTGSDGFLGAAYVKHLKTLGKKVIGLDFSTPINLDVESEVRSWFKNNSGNHLVNFFGVNDHISSQKKNVSYLNLPLTMFENIVRTNVISLFSVCREFIRFNESGTIVNISSIYSLVSPNPSLYSFDEKNIAYGVSKAAVNQLGRHLAVHAAPKFRINSIILGGIQKNQPTDFIEAYSQLTPLGRMGEPQDLFGMVDFLSGPTSSYVTGSSITLDGGWTCL